MITANKSIKPNTTPAIASPSPVFEPLLFLMLLKATNPKIIAANPNKIPKTIKPIIPNMILAMAPQAMTVVLFSLLMSEGLESEV